MKLTKSQIKKWLEERTEYWHGQYMEAEQADNSKGIAKADEKIESIELILEEIDKI